MRRALFVVAVVIILTGEMEGSARGALFLMFSGAQASPGAQITLQTGGRGALAGIPSGTRLPVYLVRSEHQGQVISPEDSRLIPVGRLQVDQNGDGRLRFVVPDVPFGSYTTLIQCAPCVSSGASPLLPTGPFPGAFVIVAPAGDGAAPDGSEVIALALALVASAVGVVLALFARTYRSRDFPAA